MKKICVLLASVLSLTCATSRWKIQGGPDTCRKMCKDWGLEFTSMVGVGNQERTGEGATACVCQPKEALKASNIPGASSSAASMSGPIVAAAQAAAAAAASTQMQMMQMQAPHK